MQAVGYAGPQWDIPSRFGRLLARDTAVASILEHRLNTDSPDLWLSAGDRVWVSFARHRRLTILSEEPPPKLRYPREYRRQKRSRTLAKPAEQSDEIHFSHVGGKSPTETCGARCGRIYARQAPLGVCRPTGENNHLVILGSRKGPRG